MSEDKLSRQCIAWNVTEYRDCKYSEAESNYCRNMDDDNYGPWCYVYDKYGEIDSYCDIPHCLDIENNNTECRTTPRAKKYAGTLSVSYSGSKCLYWANETYSHYSFLSSWKNYCRYFEDFEDQIPSIILREIMRLLVKTV